LLEYAFRVRGTRELNLPEWRDTQWRELFYRGLQFVAMFVVTFIVPLLAGWLVSRMLDILTLGMLGFMAYLPLGLMGLVAPLLFLASIHLYVKDGLFSDAWNIRHLLLLAMAGARPMTLPCLAFWGLMALFWPVYGFAFFIGFLALIAYSTALFLSLRTDRVPSY
jgi:uncharacterized membrane protein YhdT